MSDPAETNADQLAFWNGPGGQVWVERQAHTDATLALVSAALLARAAPRPGERVLDVGCGCGALTLELARAVGPTGHVAGLDISAPMLAEARARARAAGLQNVAWLQADAASAALEGFDLLISSFGLMFFGDPVAAFAHLRRAARPNARAAFVCWRPLPENPWLAVPMRAIGPHLSEQPPEDPQGPGMFALADPARIARILGEAGWARPTVEPLQLELDIAAGRGLDQAVVQTTKIGLVSAWLQGEPAETVAAATASIREALTSHVEGASVRLPAAMWLVTSAPA